MGGDANEYGGGFVLGGVDWLVDIPAIGCVGLATEGDMRVALSLALPFTNAGERSGGVKSVARDSFCNSTVRWV